MVDVYRHGQNYESEPAFQITLEEAQWWWTIGAAQLGEAPGMNRPSGKGASKRRILILSKPTSDRILEAIQCSSLGVSLTWAVLRGQPEALACVEAFRHASAPVVAYARC